MNKTILITGGTGYIGSHTAYLMSKAGYKIIIIDKFLHNQKFSSNEATVIKADFADATTLNKIFTENSIDAVMHFAAFIEIGESVKKPSQFYENNVSKVYTLLNTMLKHNVKKFIFSSSCAVYGNPVKMPMDESHPQNPVSPYGRNKLAVEFALQDYAHAYDLQFVSLRYFNASGALPEENLGEQHTPETHLIPLLLRAIRNKTPFKLFGTNYKTKDGTCVRDYIHVLDIAQAHLLALQYLEKNNKSDFFNLGTGTGYTVKQVVTAAEKICNAKAIIQNCDPRPGDAKVLVADQTKAKKVLGWVPQYSNLNEILKSALAWEEKQHDVNSISKQLNL